VTIQLWQILFIVGVPLILIFVYAQIMRGSREKRRQFHAEAGADYAERHPAEGHDAYVSRVEHRKLEQDTFQRRELGCIAVIAVFVMVAAIVAVILFFDGDL